MGKPKFIQFGEDDITIPILYEDRGVIAIDKPAGWLCAPSSWEQTGRNLQLALESSVGAGDFWAHSRNVKFIRFIHRLDAETTGVLLMARSMGALSELSRVFEERTVEKRYLAVVHGVPKEKEWTCDLPIGEQHGTYGRMAANGLDAKDAVTHFRVVQALNSRALVEAEPVTGRTHQIRVHLAASGHPVINDTLYGPPRASLGLDKRRDHLALRAVFLSYPDPFQKRRIFIAAPAGEFVRAHGFAPLPARSAKETAEGEGDRPGRETGTSAGAQRKPAK
ncbi:MAG: RluA family pseudouridine synthase [Verrucomicrobia bacterium]|nr:RluA family pseudouridine synthase [Verrucomicrobiota bacterium]